jgi:2-phospho-L-lactate/phosphoenolpyruvate guanylyltransferase
VRTAAVLPVKRFSHAKQRLGAHVDDELRLRLARAMVSDVLEVVLSASSIDTTIVVTSEPSVAAEARAQGALVLPDSAGSGQSAAVAIGIARALADCFERVLCLPGDCPALERRELEQLLARESPASGRGGKTNEAEVVIVPDRHGTGTNGLLLTPPDVIAPSFGPGSCARHRERARSAEARCRLEHPQSLLLDIDTGEDLAVLRERLANAGAPAPRTRALLAASDRRPSLITSRSD